MCPRIEISAFVAIGVVHEHYGSESALMKHLPHGLPEPGPLFQHETWAHYLVGARLAADAARHRRNYNDANGWPSPTVRNSALMKFNRCWAGPLGGSIRLPSRFCRCDPFARRFSEALGMRRHHRPKAPKSPTPLEGEKCSPRTERRHQSMLTGTRSARTYLTMGTAALAAFFLMACHKAL